MRPTSSSRSHPGFSIVELLVVLAIIGAVLGLLLPAMLRAKSSAQRVQCLNNLKQIALALHTYESRSGTFPPGYITRLDGRGNEQGPGWGWGTLLLPQMEQSRMSEMVDPTTDVLDPANQAVGTTRISTFVCPTDQPPPTWEVRDGLPPDGPFGPVLGTVASASYVGVAGPGPIGPDCGGFFARNKVILLADIVDGTSQTLMVGERHHKLGPATWTAAIPNASLVPVAPSEPIRIGGPAMVLGRVGGEDGPGGPQTAPDGFRGDHLVPGAQFAFADGSVRFLGASMDRTVYRALSTRAGGEMISDDD